MRMQTPYDVYVHAAETTPPSIQIIMLYDAAINYVRQAKIAINNEDHDTKCALINKATSIMHGLRACLDFSLYKDVALSMDRYYDELDMLMVSIQCNDDEKSCDAVVENMVIIRNMWKEINNKNTNLDTPIPQQEDVPQSQIV